MALLENIKDYFAQTTKQQVNASVRGLWGEKYITNSNVLTFVVNWYTQHQQHSKLKSLNLEKIKNLSIITQQLS